MPKKVTKTIAYKGFGRAMIALKIRALHVLLVAGIAVTCLRLGLWDRSITLMRMLP